MQYIPVLYGKKCWDAVLNCQSPEELRKCTLIVQKEIGRPGDPTDINADGSAGWHEKIRRSLGYIEANYMEDVSLEMTAQYAESSVFYLSRLFRQELDMTFLEALTDVRLIHAVELMRENKMSLASIAERVGYPNAGYFYRLFKRNMGVSAARVKELLEESGI